ncbi:MAG: hypothetical protein ABFS21_01960 [Actinomycetota bacterium]
MDGFSDLDLDGTVFLEAGFMAPSVYVESVDRLVAFRHDWSEAGLVDNRIEAHILIEMLDRMNWLPTASD